MGNRAPYTRLLGGFGLCALAAGLVACGSSNSTSTTEVTVTRTASNPATATATATSSPAATSTSASMTEAQAAHAYLVAVRPYNEAVDALRKKAATWNDSTAGAEVQSAAAPVVAAARRFQSDLLTLSKSYPSAKADLRAADESYGSGGC